MPQNLEMEGLRSGLGEDFDLDRHHGGNRADEAGFLGDVHRYPTRGLRMKKEISDVLEFILLRAGTPRCT